MEVGSVVWLDGNTPAIVVGTGHDDDNNDDGRVFVAKLGNVQEIATAFDPDADSGPGIGSRPDSGFGPDAKFGSSSSSSSTASSRSSGRKRKSASSRKRKTASSTSRKSS